MRSSVLAATLLAGLLAMTAPPAAALCAVDEEGGCSRIQHFVRLDVSEDCPDERTFCLVDADGNFSMGPNDADWDVTIHNPTELPVTFELFAFGRYDDDGMPVRDDRVAPQLVATIEVAAGETAFLDDAHVPGNVSYVRAQVLAEGDRQAELESELANYRIMMMQPGEGPVDGEEPQGNLDDDVPEDGDADADAESKDSPGLPLALLVIGCLAAVLAARRLK